MIGCSEPTIARPLLRHAWPCVRLLGRGAWPCVRLLERRAWPCVRLLVSWVLAFVLLAPVLAAAQESAPQPPAAPELKGADEAVNKALEVAPAMPATPESPVPLDKLPSVPQAPKLPGPLGDALQPSMPAPPAQPGAPTRREIDSRKKLVLLPRVGLLYVYQPKTLPGDDPASQTLPAVTQGTFGAELQIGIKRAWYITAEGQALYILAGGYGLGDERQDNILRFGEGSLTSLTGVGFGRFTKFLDSYQVWTRAALKLGYLHPYYGLLWLSGDLTRQFGRTPQHYWEISLAPSLGLAMPLDVSGAEIFQRLGFFAGLQVSAAFIFAPLGG